MGGADQPLKLDSRKPTMPVENFTMKEGRYAMLAQSDPDRSKQLMQGAQHDADARWQLYEQMAGVHRVVTEMARRQHPMPRRRAQPTEPAPAAAAARRGRHEGVHIMSVDLRSRYLGLELKNPIVAAASPLTEFDRQPQAAARTPASPPSCCRRCSRSRSNTRRWPPTT